MFSAGETHTIDGHHVKFLRDLSGTDMMMPSDVLIDGATPRAEELVPIWFLRFLKGRESV